MRNIVLITGLLLLAGCEVPPPSMSADSYDPRLYDASGHVVTPVVAAPAPAPECREVERTVEIGGRPQTAYATACRQPDGTWRFTN